MIFVSPLVKASVVLVIPFIAACGGSSSDPTDPASSKDPVTAYSGEREHSFRLNVNTFFFNALPTEVFTPGVHVQSIS